jgi:hypothetical protein
MESCGDKSRVWGEQGVGRAGCGESCVWGDGEVCVKP